jgi:GrpB-like predicted nucleotidyltransferase (UPF0157 family)
MRHYFGQTTLGLTEGIVRLVESDPGWPSAFSRLAASLSRALADLAIAIEHVGSTSVRGLDAKPILDIAVGLAPGVHDRDVIAKLTRHGYKYRGDFREDGGLLFVLGDRQPDRWVAHIHIVRYRDPQWCNYLAFRDRLRRDRAARAKYAQLNRALEATYPTNRTAYTAAKAAFIKQLLAMRSSDPPDYPGDYPGEEVKALHAAGEKCG